jgi:hypothetical protein
MLAVQIYISIGSIVAVQDFRTLYLKITQDHSQKLADAILKIVE